MMMRNVIYAAAVLCLLAGCGKEAPSHGGADDAIGFRIYTPEVSSKAEVTQENLRSTSDVKVYVYETVNNIFDKALLTPETDGTLYTGRWMTSPVRSWTDYEGRRTSFHALAYSPADAEGNGLTVSAKGLQIQVAQPKEYDATGAGNIDYLLSYTVPVEPEVKPKPLVALDMEHAMAKVEVYVCCADAMVDNDTHEIEVTLTGLTFRNIYYSATLTCQNHRTAAGTGTNYWTVGGYGAADAVYSLPEDVKVRPKSDDISENLVMDFIAIPVDRADMGSGYVMNVEYRVRVTDRTTGQVQEADFSSDFRLSAYTDGWHNAHKVRYEFLIDSGISLTGTITDWVEVDFVEGVVLPEIKEDETNEGQ